MASDDGAASELYAQIARLGTGLRVFVVAHQPLVSFQVDAEAPFVVGDSLGLGKPGAIALNGDAVRRSRAVFESNASREPTRRVPRVIPGILLRLVLLSSNGYQRNHEQDACRLHGFHA